MSRRGNARSGLLLPSAEPHSVSVSDVVLHGQGRGESVAVASP